MLVMGIVVVIARAISWSFGRRNVYMSALNSKTLINHLSHGQILRQSSRKIYSITIVPAP